MSLTHKITNVPNSQNTFETQFSLKSMIVYSLAFSFEGQQENMPKTFLYTFENLVLVPRKKVLFFNKKTCFG